MAILREFKPFRGTVELMFDDYTSLKIRKKDWADFPLNVGDDVELEEYENQISARQFAEAYDAALTVLDYSARTESEIRKKLDTKGYLPSVCDAVILRLRETQLVNDTEFAHRMTESFSAKQTGIYTLKRKLRSRGICEEDTESALSEISDEDQLSAAISTARKLARKYEGQDYRAFRAKLSQALARRGFRWDTIEQAIEAVQSDDE